MQVIDKNKDSKKGINPVAIGAVGIAVTAIAGTAAMMLSDKKRRKRVGRVLNTLSIKGKELVRKANITVDRVQRKLNEVNESIPSGGRRKVLVRA